MRAIVIENPGLEGKLALKEFDVPKPGPGQVLIRTGAAGLNRADLFQLQGKYPPPEGAPASIPGLEVAGEIEAVGDGMSVWKRGDQVCALLEGGGYAEYCLAPAGQVLPIPRGFSMEQAAALPEAVFTAWLGLYVEGMMENHDSVLIHGGASGVGTMAIQLAVGRDQMVFATAGTREKCEMCEKLGAKRAIHYESEDFVEVIRKETEGRGVDVILDICGGDYIQKNLSVAAVGGRIVMLSFLRGAKTEVNFAPLLLKRLKLIGSVLRSRSHEEKAALARQVEEQVWLLLNAGKIQPVIDSSFSLEQADTALERMKANKNIGKILLTM